MSRRFGQSTSVAAASLMTNNQLFSQKRFDHDRWYGHTMALDVSNYKFTNEQPRWMRREPRDDKDTERIAKVFPSTVEFAASYELLLMDAARLNAVLGRKEFGNEVKFRLEKQANTVARSQALIKAGTYAKDEAVENTMIARIADEEHIRAEMMYTKCIRANEVAEDNRLDILPGGSPNSLREKARWNMPLELHPIDRREIMDRLMAWLPEKYHIVYTDDFQTAAANDAQLRASMLTTVDQVGKELKAEAKASGYTNDLDEVIEELKEDVDPTRDITMAKINKSKSLDELEAWSRMVHEYNGDRRMLAIYKRAAELRNCKEDKELLAKIEAWWPKAKDVKTAN